MRLTLEKMLMFLFTLLAAISFIYGTLYDRMGEVKQGTEKLINEVNQ